MITKVYINKTDFLNSYESYIKHYHSVPEYRRKKIDAYKTDADKKLSLAVGTLLSYALKKENIEESTLELICTPNGHPYFKNRKDIFFSLSHSGKYAMCVISDSEVGCDVESYATAKDIDLDKWTKMESYLKATDGTIDALLNKETFYDKSFAFYEINKNNEYKYMVCYKSGKKLKIFDNVFLGTFLYNLSTLNRVVKIVHSVGP